MLDKPAAKKRATRVLFSLIDIWVAKLRKMLPVHAYVCLCLVGILIVVSCWTSLEVQARSQRLRPQQHAWTHLRSAASVNKLDADADDQGKDLCFGRRIFMYDLPPQFNSALVGKCKYGMTKWLNFCPHAQNSGLGVPYVTYVPSELFNKNPGLDTVTRRTSSSPSPVPPLPSWMASDVEGLGPGWYKSDPYMLELVFHSRMQKYPCLTTDSSRADAFFLPYYTGVDALTYLYNNSALKDSHGENLARWIEENAHRQWSRFGGKDHFMVLARTTWDFYLLGNGTHTQWGTGLLQAVPHMRNLTALIIEKKPWVKHEQAIPYLTSFHPSALELRDWLTRVKSAQRPSLLAFAGASRSNIPHSIRSYLREECSKSSSCTLVDCSVLKCNHNPEPIIKAFLHSSFCLQPRGDTPTRRSAFDSMIAGCIPVFFHKDSAYTQYPWHLPEDPGSYSVFIAEQQIRNGLLVENVLKSIPAEEVLKMRQTVISVIPKLVYARENGEFDDAFEISVKNVLSRVKKMKQEQKLT